MGTEKNGEVKRNVNVEFEELGVDSFDDIPFDSDLDVFRQVPSGCCFFMLKLSILHFPRPKTPLKNSMALDHIY